MSSAAPALYATISPLQWLKIDDANIKAPHRRGRLSQISVIGGSVGTTLMISLCHISRILDSKNAGRWASVGESWAMAGESWAKAGESSAEQQFSDIQLKTAFIPELTNLLELL